jgi:hypothetical protein
MAKETKYSWHLSLRVDRPVEVRFYGSDRLIGVIIDIFGGDYYLSSSY